MTERFWNMPTKAKRVTVSITLALAVVGSAVWFFVAYEGPLDRPVLDGKPIGYWLDKMAMDEHNDRNQIRDRIVSLGEPAISPLLVALEDRPSALKRKITTPFLLNHFPKLAEWLWRRRPASSWMAAYTLAEMPPDPRIRDGLIRSLRWAKSANQDSDVGFYAARGLGDRYTNDWAIVVPDLRAALQVPHHNIQAQAALALPRFGTNGLAALPDLIRLLGGNDDYLSSRTARALGFFGPAARCVLPTIRPLLTNKEPEVRRDAAIAIWRITPGSSFPTDVLLECMKIDSAQERVLAAEELGRLNPAHSAAAVELFIKVINSAPEITNGDPTHWFRWHSAYVLGEVGATAKAALPILIQAETSDSNEEMKRVAKSARQKIEKALDWQQNVQHTTAPQ